MGFVSGDEAIDTVAEQRKAIDVFSMAGGYKDYGSQHLALFFGVSVVVQWRGLAERAALGLTKPAAHFDAIGSSPQE